MRVLVTSLCPSKVDAVLRAMNVLYPGSTVTGVRSESGVAPQPWGTRYGIEGAVRRIDSLGTFVDEFDMVVSIESFIEEEESGTITDSVAIVVRTTRGVLMIKTFRGEECASGAALFHVFASTSTPSGYATTYGEALHARNPSIKADDWYVSTLPTSSGHRARVSRSDCIYLSIMSMFESDASE